MFFFQSYVVFQVQYVVRRLLYNAEIHAFDTENGRISMIDQLIVNVDKTTTSTVLLPSQSQKR